MKKLLFLLAFFCAFLYSPNAFADWYLCGSFSGHSWTTSDASYKFTSQSSNVFTLQVSGTDVSGAEFKINNGSWGNNNDNSTNIFGSPYSDDNSRTLTLNTDFTLWRDDYSLANNSNKSAYNLKFPTLSSGNYIVTFTNNGESTSTIKIAPVASVAYTLVSASDGAFYSKNGQELTETSTSGLYKLNLGGITATANQAFTLSDGTNAIKATNSTSCTNTLVAGSTSASNNFIVDAGTYYSLYMQKSGDTYNVLASTNPTTPTVTANTSVSGTTVTITATTNIPAANVTSYSISRGGTVLNSSVTPAEDGSFTYTDNSQTANGTYSYTVTATYNECSTLLISHATSSAVTATITEGVTASEYTLYTWANGAFGTTYNGQSFLNTSTDLTYMLTFPSAGVAVSASEGYNTTNLSETATAGFLVKNGDGTEIRSYGGSTGDANIGNGNQYATNQWNSDYVNGDKHHIYVTAATYYRIYLKREATGSSVYHVLASTVPITGQTISPSASASGSTISISCAVPSFLPATNSTYIKNWTIKEGETTIASSEDAGAALAYDVTNASVGSHTYTVTLNYSDLAGIYTYTASGEVTASVSSTSPYTLFTWTDANGMSAFYKSDDQTPAFTNSGVSNLYAVTFTTPRFMTSTQAGNGYLIKNINNNEYLYPTGTSPQVAADAFLGLTSGSITSNNIVLNSGIGKYFYKVYLYTDGSTYRYALASTIPTTIASKTPALTCNTSGNVLVGCNVPDSLKTHYGNITGYDIYRDGTLLGSLSSTDLTNGAGTYTDANANVGTTYAYTVVCKYRDINGLSAGIYTVSSPELSATVSASASITAAATATGSWYFSYVAGTTSNITNSSLVFTQVEGTTNKYTLTIPSGGVTLDGTAYFNIVNGSTTYNHGLICFRDTWTPLQNLGNTDATTANDKALKMADQSITVYGVTLYVDSKGYPYVYFSTEQNNATPSSTPSTYCLWTWSNNFGNCRASFESVNSSTTDGTTTSTYRIMFPNAQTVGSSGSSFLIKKALQATKVGATYDDNPQDYLKSINTDAVTNNVWYTVGTGGTSSYTNDINVAAGSYFGMLLKTVTASDGTTTYQFKLLTYKPSNLVSTGAPLFDPDKGKVILLGTALTWDNASDEAESLDHINNTVVLKDASGSEVYNSGVFKSNASGTLTINGGYDAIKNAKTAEVTADYYKLADETGGAMATETATTSVDLGLPTATVTGNTNGSVYENHTFYARVLSGSSSTITPVKSDIAAPVCFAILRHDNTLNNDSLVSRCMVRVKDANTTTAAWNNWVNAGKTYNVSTDANCTSINLNGISDSFTRAWSGTYSMYYHANAYFLLNNESNVYYSNRSDVASGAPALTLESARIKTETAQTTLPSDLTAIYAQANYTYSDPFTNVAIASGSKASTWYTLTDVYKSGDITFNTSLPTGIDGINADGVKVIGGNEMIMVYGATNVSVFDMTGRLITRVSNVNEIPVASGIYIVHADQATAKVIVK